MNKTLSLRIRFSFKTHPNASDTLPAHLCASSANPISNAGILRSFCAIAIKGEDWYVENTTFAPSLRRKDLISFTSPVTGTPMSVTWVNQESSVRSCFATDSSEQTQSHLNGVFAAAVHSRRVCDSRLNDGTRTNTCSAFSFSLIQSEVRVLPVPQAMIN